MKRRMPFLDGDENSTARIANLSASDEFGIDGRAVFG
jgi:hypothetical protein